MGNFTADAGLAVAALQVIDVSQDGMACMLEGGEVMSQIYLAHGNCVRYVCNSDEIPGPKALVQKVFDIDIPEQLHHRR
jgi:uncharacterized membrane protein YraQ (UPF0718 family)